MPTRVHIYMLVQTFTHYSFSTPRIRNVLEEGVAKVPTAWRVIGAAMLGNAVSTVGSFSPARGCVYAQMHTHGKVNADDMIRIQLYG